MNDFTHGQCPSCNSTGLLGTACGEPICSQRGTCFIPAEGLPTDPSLPRDPLLGISLDDYLISGLIGAGGFGRVYLALKRPIFMKTALKLLSTEDLPEQLTATLGAMFSAEAHALAVLQHPNIVRLLHYGTFHNRPYLVTEYIERGITLEADIEQRAAEGKAYGIGELRELFRQLLDGLAAAHAEGIVHRDLKPGNIMLQDALGYPRLVRLLDFGLAKFLSAGNQTLSTAGTPDYMAPEQITREPLGAWTDLYAVGIIACELFTGRLPFTAASVQELCLNKVDSRTDPVANLADLPLPEPVLSFLRVALARDPDRRYQHVAAMRLGISRALDSLPAALPPRSRLTDAASISAAPTELKHLTPLYPLMPPKKSDDAFRRWLEREEQRLAPSKQG